MALMTRTTKFKGLVEGGMIDVRDDGIVTIRYLPSDQQDS